MKALKLFSVSLLLSLCNSGAISPLKVSSDSSVIQVARVDLVIAATTDLTIEAGGTFVVTVPSDVTMYTSGLSCSAET